MSLLHMKFQFKLLENFKILLKILKRIVLIVISKLIKKFNRQRNHKVNLL